MTGQSQRAARDPNTFEIESCNEGTAQSQRKRTYRKYKKIHFFRANRKYVLLGTPEPLKTDDWTFKKTSYVYPGGIRSHDP
jgi:hypothetical protein